MMRRLAGAALLATLVAMSLPSTALADAAGPTDFRSEVVSVTPASDAVAFSIEGGDAFVRMVVLPGHEVVVSGHEDEPYLRIGPDGVVQQNRRSFATYANTSRRGDDQVPDIVDPMAEPDWETVGSGGSWAWHDHRAHWMGRAPPIGLEPGGSLPAQDIPMIVDGVSTTVQVVTTLQASPSVVPAIVGFLVGVVLVGLALLAGSATLVLVTAIVGVAALATGAAQYLSMSGDTGPMVTWWLLPALATASAVAAMVATRPLSLVRSALVLLSGVELSLLGFRRRTGLVRAVIPTDLPFWLDRAVTAGTLVTSVIVVIASLVALLRPPPRPIAYPAADAAG
ncbi:MAG: hypothetical protein ABIO83_08955 [Ilumatobacteraceae bacterium]